MLRKTLRIYAICVLVSVPVVAWLSLRTVWAPTRTSYQPSNWIFDRLLYCIAHPYTGESEDNGVAVAIFGSDMDSGSEFTLRYNRLLRVLTCYNGEKMIWIEAFVGIDELQAARTLEPTAFPQSRLVEARCIAFIKLGLGFAVFILIPTIVAIRLETQEAAS